MTAYYNEHDPFAAAWLRELIKDNLIAPGDVDERSIEDVLPADLLGYSQHHFFAGIGVWSLALREAGWPDEQPIWTGSCPCQPFSAAGKGGGFADERHLWPSFEWLIRQLGPDIVAGEQVSGKDSRVWLDLVSNDMEAKDYAFGAVSTVACGYGAPFEGERTFWMAASDGGELRLRQIQHGRKHGQQPAPSQGQQPWEWGGLPIHTNTYWRDADWIRCTSAANSVEWRPCQPGSYPLVDAGQLRNRLAEMRGAGNAVNIAQARAFIEAMMEITG